MRLKGQGPDVDWRVKEEDSKRPPSILGDWDAPPHFMVFIWEILNESSSALMIWTGKELSCGPPSTFSIILFIPFVY